MYDFDELKTSPGRLPHDDRRLTLEISPRRGAPSLGAGIADYGDPRSRVQLATPPSRETSAGWRGASVTMRTLIGARITHIAAARSTPDANWAARFCRAAETAICPLILSLTPRAFVAAAHFFHPATS